MKLVQRLKFWDHVLTLDDPGARPVTRQVLYFTGYSALVQVANEFTNRYYPHWGDWGLAVAPYEVAGAALSALLVLRTNAGYERWWEARKLWGSITNQSRNLAILMLANGPDDPRWRREAVGWIAAFAHATRHSLRAERDTSELVTLLGADEAARVERADHMPVAVSMRIAVLLRDARDRDVLDRLAFNRAEEQRCLLVDHMGGCERILRTPLAAAYVVLIRRFIVLFLMMLPWALMPRVGWFAPIFMLLLTYPILALDRIGDDLQHPFSVPCINHLPLDDITSNIERNLMALLDEPLSAEEAGRHLSGTASGG